MGDLYWMLLVGYTRWDDYDIKGMCVYCMYVAWIDHTVIHEEIGAP